MAYKVVRYPHCKETVWEGELDFGNGNKKSFSIIQDYYSGNINDLFRVEFGKGGTGLVEKARRSNEIILKHDIIILWNKAIFNLCSDIEFQKYLNYNIAEEFYNALCYEIFQIEQKTRKIDIEPYKGISSIKKMITCHYETIEIVGDLFWFSSNGNLKNLIDEETGEKLVEN